MIVDKMSIIEQSRALYVRVCGQKPLYGTLACASMEIMADAQSFFVRIDVTCRNLPSRTIINEILILINFQYVSINLKEPAEKLN